MSLDVSVSPWLPDMTSYRISLDVSVSPWLPDMTSYRMSLDVSVLQKIIKNHRGCNGHDCMVVGFTTPFAMSANQYKSCGFESQSGEVYSIQH